MRNCHSTSRELGSTTIDLQYFLEKCLRISALPVHFLTLSFPTCLRVLRPAANVPLRQNQICHDLKFALIAIDNAIDVGTQLKIALKMTER